MIPVIEVVNSKSKARICNFFRKKVVFLPKELVKDARIPSYFYFSLNTFHFLYSSKGCNRSICALIRL